MNKKKEEKSKKATNVKKELILIMIVFTISLLLSLKLLQAKIPLNESYSCLAIFMMFLTLALTRRGE